jgi:hypothetical protein
MFLGTQFGELCIMVLSQLTLRVIKETSLNLSQDRRTLDRDLNPELPEYET